MDVLLVSLPFGPLLYPSIGLSLLKEGLIEKGYKVKIKYFTIDFAKYIGAELYSIISRGYPASQDMVGEWLFSNILFNHSLQDRRKFLSEIVKGENKRHAKNYTEIEVANKKFVDAILETSYKIPTFIENCKEEIISINAKIVGFTSVFQQHLASICVAKEIKKKNKNIITVFGGANNEGIMGIETYNQFFDYIDMVVSGEGDIVFPKIVEMVLNGEDITSIKIKGVVNKGNLQELLDANTKVWSAASVQKMDSLPYVCYDDYFEQFSNTDLGVEIEPRILFETSRGCWWGMTHHCTFCGLNGDNMQQRTKSAERAIDELFYLHNKYPSNSISVVDNILDYRYFKNFIPALAENKPKDLNLFYEVKANLTKEQVKQLKNAGVDGIQPGIESLSDEVLKIMRKGVTAFQNIQLLKWCKEVGVEASWNLLYGFPGESPSEYEKMSELIPCITHLKPPMGSGSIRLDRFSPNFNDSSELGFLNVNAYPTYNYIYPFDQKVINNLAYYFTFDYKLYQDIKHYTSKLLDEVKKWETLYEESDLFYVDKGTVILVWDFRPIATKNLIILKDERKLIYTLCDKAKTLHQLKQALALRYYDKINGDLIYHYVLDLHKKNLVFFDGLHVLSLAIPLSDDYSPNKAILVKLQNSLSDLGELVENNFEVDINNLEYEQV
jgi:ribosomal peptide maturation radical SAM protein 1